MLTARYRKRPIVVEATQWLNKGYHDAVTAMLEPEPEPRASCLLCGEPRQFHGVLDTREGPMLVCPGDYIIKGIKGELYPCKPDIFKETYDPL